ncbi:MAG: UDP-N-acetylmuramate dehydrogenase [bacterium]
MNYTNLKRSLESKFNIRCKLNHSLKLCSSFHLGGTARLFAEPATTAALVSLIKFCRLEKISYYMVGNGSNVIFSDKPFEGVIITTKKINRIKFRKNIIVAEAGINLDTLVKRSIKKALAGFEELSHIPGSLGGAIRMNAGAFHAEVADYLVDVKVLDPQNRIKTLNRYNIDFGYREAPPLNSMIILEARFRLFRDNVKDLMRRRREIIKKRNRKHPLKYPSAGSVFKRPEGYFVRKLIELSGLPGKRVGGAQISKKHPGFIVNLGNAKSSDVVKLIKIIRDKIFKNFKLNLELEQIIVGDDLMRMLK